MQPYAFCEGMLSLVPRRRAPDFNHHMENWNKVLRFKSRMVPVGGRRSPSACAMPRAGTGRLLGWGGGQGTRHDASRRYWQVGGI